MIQQEKPELVGTMPVVWPTLLDLGRDECKRILRKLGELFCPLCAFLSSSAGTLYLLNC